MKFLNNIDLQQNELQKAKIHVLGTDPESPVAGQIYFNSSDGRLKIYDGTDWRYASALFTNADISSSAAIELSKLETDPLDRANHTGTQTASTISDFDDQVHTSRLDQMAAPEADVDWNDYKITGLADPDDPQDAATKAYVDAVSIGLDVKQSARAATTADIVLANLQTLDTSVTLIAGDRVLVKDQDDATENGIYVVVAGGAWTRADDAVQGKLNAGAFVFVEEGDLNASNGYVLSTPNPVTIGDDDITWVQFSGAGEITAGDGLTKDGNRLDVGGTTDRIVVNSDSVDIDENYAGQASIDTLGTVATGTWEADTIAVDYGGTGATDAAGAKTNLGFTTTYAANVGNSSDTSFVITHDMDTRDCIVQVRENGGSYAQVQVDVEYTTANSVTLNFASAPTANAYRVIVIG
jgi:hypothetical protein